MFGGQFGNKGVVFGVEIEETGTKFVLLGGGHGDEAKRISPKAPDGPRRTA